MTSNVCQTVSLLDTKPYVHQVAVRSYLQHRAELHDHIGQLSIRRKEEEAVRYNRGARLAHPLAVDDLCMLYQERTGKLEPRWRGPFIIAGYSNHSVLYTIKQINGRGIRGTFHGDHLKLFVPRTGYLASSDKQIPQQ